MIDSVKNALLKKELYYIRLCILLGPFEVSTTVFAPMWSHFLELLGGSTREASVAVVVYLSSVCFFTIFFGFYIKKFQKYKIFVNIAFASYAFFSLGLFFVQNVTELFIIQALLGFSCGLQAPALGTIYGKIAQEADSSIRWAYNTASSNIAYGFGALIGGVLLHHFSIRAVFIFIFLMGLMAFYVSIYFIDKDR